MMNDERGRPLGMINGTYFYQGNIDFAERMIAEYTAKTKEMLARADECHPKRRGGYRTQARRRARDVARWQRSLELFTSHVATWDASERLQLEKLPEPDLESFR